MKADDPLALESLAASVADGTPIDWTAPGLSAEERRLLANLRVIQTLAQVYRSLPADTGAPGGTAALDRVEPDGPRWGRLVLLDRVGHGTSADVFRAWDGDLQREVALKLLYDDGASANDEANTRLLQEARRLARVTHPHVVHVYGAERHEGRVGLWMELVRGRSLDAIVREDGPMAPMTAARTVADVCSAVAAVHAAGLLHRDIKAQNVVVEEGGRLVLMDFGTGEEIGQGAARLAGTPLYLAPEIFAGAAATTASDVYSLGVLVFYLLTGRYPIHAASLEALAAEHRARRRRAPEIEAPELPGGLARIVARALHPDPARRFQGAAAMEEALRGWMAERSAPPRRMTWRGRAIAAVTTAAVAALVLTVGWRSWEHRTVGPATAIAVLPLRVTSGGDKAPLIAEALTDELTTMLGRVDTLRVTAHTSVLRYRGTERPVKEIASALGVGSVLEGSVGFDEDPQSPRVRVNLRLIRAGTDIELWTDSFDRPLSELQALEADIVRAVARSVRARLTDSPARSARTGSANPQAEQAYLEGMSYLAQNRAGAEIYPARDAFQKAVALDPAFAAAHAALARTYVLLGFSEELPQDQAYANARQSASRALALEPDLVEGHVVSADIGLYYDWDWTGADAEYRRAIALDPGNARIKTQYAQLLAALGRTREAIEQARSAVAVDSLTADVTLTLGLMQYYDRQFDAARATLQQALRMDPRFPGAYFTLGRIEEAAGRLDEATRLFERALTISDIAPWRVELLRVQALAGQAAAARSGLSALKSRLAARGIELGGPYEAYVRLALGERSEALDLLTDAVSARSPFVLWMAVDPRLDSLRGDPRFDALVVRLGRP
jgi:serine/threonine-protein kinase